MSYLGHSFGEEVWKKKRLAVEKTRRKKKEEKNQIKTERKIVHRKEERCKKINTGKKKEINEEINEWMNEKMNEGKKTGSCEGQKKTNVESYK